MLAPEAIDPMRIKLASLALADAASKSSEAKIKAAWPGSADAAQHTSTSQLPRPAPRPYRTFSGVADAHAGALIQL